MFCNARYFSHLSSKRFGSIIRISVTPNITLGISSEKIFSYVKNEVPKNKYLIPILTGIKYLCHSWSL